MFWNFFKRRIQSKKQNKNCGIEPLESSSPTTGETGCCRPSQNSEINGSVEEQLANNQAAARPNTLETQAIPEWASSWLRPNITEELDQEKANPNNGVGKTNNQLNLLTQNDSKPDLETLDLPTIDLIEPKNVEVREMVLRQIQNSRSTARYMCSTEDLVEEQIRKAMERGDFKNLKGKGKPIIFDENPFEDPELRMSFKILKDAGFAPYWIEMGKQIDGEIEGCHMIFDNFLETLNYRKSRLGYIQRTPEFETRMQQVLQTCADKLEEANKKIDQYNMIVPMFWIQRKKIDTDVEVAKLKQRLKEFLWGRS